MGAWRRSLVVGAVGAAAAAPAPAGAATFTMVTDQSLFPAFSTGQLDYVTGCSGGAVSVTTVLPRGATATVDGRRAATGRTTTRVKLAPGQRFDVVAGGVRRAVRCVPADFPKWTASGTLPRGAPFLAVNAITLNAGNAPFAIVIDSRGAPVWWRKAVGVSTAANALPLPGGTIGFWHGDVVRGEATANGVFERFSLGGVTERQYRATGGYTDLHEAEVGSDGNLFLISDVQRSRVDLGSLGGAPDASVVDNVIEEVDAAGRVVWSWSAADHIPVGWASRWYPVLKATSGSDPIDLFHMNSIESTSDGSLIVSFRHLDSVVKIRKSDGAILWKLGGTQAPQSLAVSGDSFPQGATFGGQHDARIFTDRTMTVFDNGSNTNGASYRNRAPRVTRWRIDPVARTATLVERFSDRDAKTSFAGGGARRLADGSWVVSWSHQPLIRAYAPDHRLVFALRNAIGRASYRAVPVAGTGFSRTAFVAGMDAQYPR